MPRRRCSTAEHTAGMQPFADPSGTPIVRLPAADDDAQRAVLDELLAMLDALPELRVTYSARFASAAARLDVPTHGAALALSLPLVETGLDCDPNEVSTALLAQLVFYSVWPALPEQLALQVAFGWDLAEMHVRDLARIMARAARRGLTVDDYVADLVTTGAVPDTLGARCFRGETPCPPDSWRVARGIRLFRRAAAHAPEESRPSMLCAVAWLFWAMGKRPNALAHLAEASRIEPTHVLVHGLTAHFTSNQPAWLGSGVGHRGSPTR